MQLFVIPVTDKLLSSGCRTVRIDVPAADRYHIPILPIIVEQIPDELFERVFGKRHYLDSTGIDNTQISFEKKLTDYLNRIASADTWSQQIRDAFDAYIFLSYRKKDRKAAQRLMNLIHKTPFCRDIAIWYDEYLVPGESFTDAIKDAMHRSSLFALAVTPNPLEQGNYVMMHEYPEALKNNMNILAAELEKTDREQLIQHYNGLPPTVDLDDIVILGQALKNTHAKKVNNEPRHLFFIGLAYLYGIDVEVNRERALNLITDAARSYGTDCQYVFRGRRSRPLPGKSSRMAAKADNTSVE